MKKDDAYDSDSCDEDYTGQPPDGDPVSYTHLNSAAGPAEPKLAATF